MWKVLPSHRSTLERHGRERLLKRFEPCALKRLRSIKPHFWTDRGEDVPIFSSVSISRVRWVPGHTKWSIPSSPEAQSLERWFNSVSIRICCREFRSWNQKGCRWFSGAAEVRRFSFNSTSRTSGRSEENLKTPGKPSEMYPEIEHCEVCSWYPVCDKRRRNDDHLSLVAGISRNQRKALGERGVRTVVGLAALSASGKAKD